MQVHHVEEKGASAAAGLLPWLAPLVLVGAAWLFGVAGPRSGADREADAGAPGSAPGRVPVGGAGTSAPAASETLARLELELPEASARRLAEVRERALETGILVQAPEDTVDATVRFEGRALPARVRLKGDWLDHLESDQWSLRVTLDEAAVLGMRVFSLQAPETVGLLLEWVCHEVLRAEGTLAPRSTFVRVAIDGEEKGVYFLQEHFAKELLESQGRREGPIVRFDEGGYWDLLLQHGLTLPGPAAARPGLVVDRAPARAFDEKSLSSVEPLARALDSATRELEELRELAVAARDFTERRRRLEAMERVRGLALEELLSIDRLTRAHAVLSLLQVEHALFWHNLRFYHDPMLDRLEPVVFDCMAHFVAEPDPVPLRDEGFVTRLATSRAYYDGVFRELGRLVEPGHVEGLLADLGPELRRLEAAVPNAQGLAVEIEERLLVQRDRLALSVLPVRGLAWQASYDLDEREGAGLVDGTLSVTLWGTTAAPMVVEGFRFSNGATVQAADAVLEEDRALLRAAEETGAVVLPHDGLPVRFRFPMDARLASLSSVRELVRAARREASGGVPLGLEVLLLARPIARSGAPDELLLRFRHVEERWRDEGGRPPAPPLAEALAAHPFLELDAVSGDLVARPGEHRVAGDLVLPAGTGLTLVHGTRLSFEPGAVLLADAPLTFTGTAEEPVRLDAMDPEAGWAGALVLEARGRSDLRHVVIADTRSVRRGGWSTTGGVTFHRAPVRLEEVHFLGSLAEDALNVVQADVELAGVRFERCASDAFDGDFVSGRASGCVLSDVGGDGVDLSGSDFRLEGSRFERVADKAVSAGEGTRLVVEGGLARSVGIGVASKDGSEVVVRALGIEEAARYAVAVYVKKEAWGPAELVAERLRLDPEAARGLLVQVGCRLEVDGRRVAGEELDVEALYRDGVLGN